MQAASDLEQAAVWAGVLTEDAAGQARDSRDLAVTAADRADAHYLLVRLAWEAGDPAGVAALTEEIEATVATLPPGPDQARAMTAVAQAAVLLGRLDTARWSGRTGHCRSRTSFSYGT